MRLEYGSDGSLAIMLRKYYNAVRDGHPQEFLCNVTLPEHSKDMLKYMPGWEVQDAGYGVYKHLKDVTEIMKDLWQAKTVDVER